MAGKSILVFLTCIVLNLAKEDDLSKLPLCPTNIDYFPQNLPMHCRMPRSSGFIGLPSEIQPGRHSRSPDAPSFYQNPPSDKQPVPIPIPIPPGGPIPYPFPGNGPPLPMPGGPFPMPGGSFPMPGGPLPMPVPMPGPSHKLPVIVMPFYSPDPAFKKNEQGKPGHEHKRTKKTHKMRHSHCTKNKDKDSESSDTDSDSSDTSSDTSSDLSSEGNGWWNYNKKPSKHSGRRSNGQTHTHAHTHSHKSKRKSSKTKGELLTPVLQYVTKDGYVIFEKKITKGEAKDWLRMRNEDPDPNKENSIDEAKMKNPTNGDDVAEAKQKKHDDGNAEYQDKSEEKAKEATTNKPHMYKKHQKM